MKYYSPPSRRTIADLDNYLDHVDRFLYEACNRLSQIESKLDKMLAPIEEIPNGLVDPSLDLRNLASEIVKIKKAMGVMK